MTTMFRSRQRAEEFNALVDGTSTVRRAADPQLEQLVGVAHALRTHSTQFAEATPRDDFVAELRERLMTEAATVLSPAQSSLALPVRTRGPRERRLVAAATAFVLLGGSAGIAAAAQDALPGEALYPIKRGIEKVEAALEMGSAGRGQELLDQATGRLDEVDSMLATADPATAAPQVPLTLEAFTAQAQEGSQLLLGSYQDTRDPESVLAVREFAARGLVLLEDISRTAPSAAQPGLSDAALTLIDMDRRAATLCSTCADLPALEVPRMFLASAEVDRALALVQDSKLDNSHPVVVPKEAVRRLDGGTGVQDRPRDTSGGDSGGSAPAPAPTAPTSIEGAVPVLPQASDAPKVRLRVEGDASKDLGGVMETLLPDADVADDLLP